MCLTLCVRVHLCPVMHAQAACLSILNVSCMMFLLCNYSACLFVCVLVRALLVYAEYVYSLSDLQCTATQRRQAGVKHTPPATGGSGGEEVDFISD